jgi:hypothetical protein
MEIDRALIDKILFYLRDHPAPQSARTWDAFAKSIGDEKKLLAHMRYLEEHRLIVSGITGDMVNSGITNLTARGVDHITPGGGLSAELGVITIKIHDDCLVRIAEFISQNASERDMWPVQ